MCCVLFLDACVEVCLVLFVYGVSSSASLRTFFAQFGEVQEAVVMKDPSTRRSRGFGFVVFTQSASVDRALTVKDLRVDGRKVRSAVTIIVRTHCSKNGTPPLPRLPPHTRRFTLGGRKKGSAS